MRAEKIISKAMHRLKRAPREIKIYKNRENIILDNMSRPAMPNRVNLDWYSECRDDGKENVGDYLSVPIFEYMTDYYGLDRNKNVGKTKHLYTVGSIIFFGYQNATIWGSGLLWKPRLAFYRDLDIRAVRGPMTRNTLLEMGGYSVPEIYGDPAILMPLVYQPKISSIRQDYGVVMHKFDSQTGLENQIGIMTDDYKSFIDQICSCKRIISSSLHGIILSEAYGIPAVLLNDNRHDFNLFKYSDYYYSTGRYEYPVASSVEEALSIQPCDLPDLTELRNGLINSFPKDLWE